LRFKANPVQSTIASQYGSSSSEEPTFSYEQSYEQIEVVNRGVNMIVDDVSEIPTRVGDPIRGISVHKGSRKVTVERLLNSQPNPYQDINSFRRNLIVDYLIDGNIFIYFDGSYLYHLPASKMIIVPDEKTYIKEYTYNDSTPFLPHEIIHIKENSFKSIYRGDSRLKPAQSTMELVKSMKKFQRNFFKNGAIPGLVLRSPDTLSQKIKDRMTASWSTKFRPDAGGRNPLILDGGLTVDSISNVNFKELDFQSSITANEKIILSALGVPPILLDSGNNANLRPNLRLYYLETVLPIAKKINFSMERFFGYELSEDITGIPALQPELREQAAYYSTLVNGGIMAVNEAREPLGLPALDGEENDKVRIPANIAGSAANPAEGGRPEEGTE